MTPSRLSAAEILDGFDAVAGLYPSVPPILIWRAWEYAAYRRFALPEPVLDIGCGDGRFFRLVFPHVAHVVGVDADAGVADAAVRSGIYREVHVRAAHTLPLDGPRFSSAFANCSLEHMDRLGDVLRGVAEGLVPGGVFLLSVVTHRFVDWAPLPLLLRAAGAPDRAASVQQEYEDYHHLRNALPAPEWERHLDRAGFDIIGRVPIVPEWTGRLFLFLDQLWHLRSGPRELGDHLEPLFASRPGFVRGFRDVLSGVLQMEEDETVGAGAVFYARRRS